MPELRRAAAAVVPRALAVAAGLWLMAMPAVLAYAGTAAAASDRIAGPFIVCFAFVALWEATRGVRWAQLPFGAWVLLSPALVDGHPPAAAAAAVASGAVVVATTFLGGAVEQRFGGGWPALFRPTPPERLEPEPRT